MKINSFLLAIILAILGVLYINIDKLQKSIDSIEVGEKIIYKEVPNPIDVTPKPWWIQQPYCDTDGPSIDPGVYYTQDTQVLC